MDKKFKVFDKVKEVIGSMNISSIKKLKDSKQFPFIIGGVVLVVVVLIILILSITGGKKLTCVKLNTADYMLYSEKLEFSFKKDSVKKLKMKYEMELAEGADYDSLEIANDMEEDCNDILKDNEIKGISCSVDYDDNFISFDLTAKKESFKYALDFDEDDKYTFDSLKEELMDEGYFCK